jgi:hypothetical protein
VALLYEQAAPTAALLECVLNSIVSKYTFPFIKDDVV